MIELDGEQQAVVDSGDSMVVDCGPGSGKTRTLTAKADRLTRQGKSVLCLCFTRAAAQEMASRVDNLPATTIHSFCCQSVGWQVPPGGTEDDGYQFLLHRFVQQNDMQFDWVLIDECQDLNPVELDAALSLAGDRIFAVGDVLQSIYGFQGALGPSVIDRLIDRGCRREYLKNNYRSGERVVAMLNAWFPRDLLPKGPKTLDATAVLCRRNDDVFEVSTFLKSKGVPHRVRLSAAMSQGREREWNVLGPNKLWLMTCHAAKGHEFDNVLLYNWYPDRYEEEERVYYVAMSRASNLFKSVSNLSALHNAVRMLSMKGEAQ